MSKKNMLKEMLAKVNAKVVEEGKVTMTQNQFESLKKMVADSDVFKVCKNKKDVTLFSIYDVSGKTRFVIIQIVEEVKPQATEEDFEVLEINDYGKEGSVAIVIKLKNSEEEVVEYLKKYAVDEDGNLHSIVRGFDVVFNIDDDGYYVFNCITSHNKSSKKSSKSKKVPQTAGGTKGKFRFYTISLKNFKEEEKVITNFNSCKQIKEFLKSINKKNVEYLRIYCDSQEVRKSAWIERKPA